MKIKYIIKNYPLYQEGSFLCPKGAMFIFDFVAETILDQILDWIYGKIIGFLNDFFVMMNNMGVELFELQR